ncbi:LOW QUALITY PROTEIN: hypothetical protein HID58_020142 [Brassica napus]|uniref:Uncharacterized protein n=1 Tax=Brassica napus TaxID=3708 RepID=A0ABQ8DER0_BRANA|nr:LOW QUALITY PROTEIN: hypothetical protein HID58_020142 [Brassica napus]
MKELHESSREKQLERVSTLCVHLLNKTLSLRIHFSTSFVLSVKRLSNISETVFKELNEMSHQPWIDHLKEHIFNLAPVLSLESLLISLDNIITCELLSLTS